MHTKQLRYYLSCLLFAVMHLYSHAQNIEAVSKPFDSYAKTHPQEKIFVHTDKSFYVAGEIIWFKLYVTDAQLNQPLSLSKVGYVEILNKEHKPVLQAKISLIDASGNGSFQLPYSVAAGNYILRAYTNWMKNDAPDYYFEKTISIVNTFKNPEWPAAENENYDIRFFPEGGNLVNGIESKVGFKITDASGVGVNANGAILNQRNDTLIRFSTLRFGMGHFSLVPDAGIPYHAVIRMPGGKIITKDLPAIQTSGMVMQLKETGKDKLLLSIQGNKAGSVVSVLIHTRQITKLATYRELFNNRTEIEIDKKQLGDGISQITVFDERNQPVCERLYFKKPASLSITANTDAQQYGTRKKVTIDLNTTDAKQLPANGDLSMSVFMLDSLQSFESSDILSYLWLQSDLKGSIESAAYYFTQQGAEPMEAADNLMLTQGWRRFAWDKVLQPSNNAMEYLPETEGHIINGKVIDKRNNQPAANITAFLSVPAEKSLFTGTTSASNGLVRFNVKNFYGGNEIVVQTNPTTDSMYRVDIANPFSEKYSDRIIPSLVLPESKAGLLTTHGLGAQTANVYFADRQQRFLFPQGIDTTAFYGVPDKRYYLDDYTRFQTMEEVMREYVQDVRVHKNSNHFSYNVRNKSFDDFFNTDPLVLMDGVPVYNVDKIVAFDPLKIKRIDVVSQKFYQNNLVHDGIISYSTYQGDLTGYQLDGNALIVEYEGMQLPREFYSPVYTANSNTRLPDFRNVLYWSPEIKTGRNGKAQVSFYTGDIPGNYAVVIQGITVGGLAGSRTSIISVSK